MTLVNSSRYRCSPSALLYSPAQAASCTEPTQLKIEVSPMYLLPYTAFIQGCSACRVLLKHRRLMVPSLLASATAHWTPTSSTKHHALIFTCAAHHPCCTVDSCGVVAKIGSCGWAPIVFDKRPIMIDGQRRLTEIVGPFSFQHGVV